MEMLHHLILLILIIVCRTEVIALKLTDHPSGFIYIHLIKGF